MRRAPPRLPGCRGQGPWRGNEAGLLFPQVGEQRWGSILGGIIHDHELDARAGDRGESPGEGVDQVGEIGSLVATGDDDGQVQIQSGGSVFMWQVM